MTSFDPLLDRIAAIEGPGQDTTQQGNGAAHASQGDDAGPRVSPPEDLAEVEAFLTDCAMGLIEYGYESRAAMAGPHWLLTDPEAATIRRPLGKVAAKWAPRLMAFIPGAAVRFKEELALCMVLFVVTKSRVMIDRRLAAEAAAQPGGSDGRDEDKGQGQ